MESKVTGNLWSQDKYDRAYRFAAHAHLGQTYPGTDISYIMHLSLVAMEVMSALCLDQLQKDADLAVTCALLHDVLEDTPTTYDEILHSFGPDVAQGVMALTKDPSLPTKQQQISDSLHRIKQQSHEIWMVKLADRVCNLAAPPPYWDNQKRVYYQEEARLILSQLYPASPSLAHRLQQKIDSYSFFFSG